MNIKRDIHYLNFNKLYSFKIKIFEIYKKIKNKFYIRLVTRLQPVGHPSTTGRSPVNYYNNRLIIIRVVIREGPGRTPGVSPSTGSGQRGEVPPRVRVEISRGRPVGPVHSGNNVIQNLLKLF